jgi:phytanoyl-CoA hydroxylase
MGARHMLWLDGEDQVEVLRRIAASTHTTTMHDIWSDGIALVTGAVPPDICDTVVAEYNAFCAANIGIEGSLSKTGNHRRLCGFHMESTTARSAMCQPELASILDEILGAPFQFYTSLFFEESTQQGIHRDSPFFCTEPYGEYLGVWVALEDVAPEAGPLTYFPGAHRIPVDRMRAYSAIEAVAYKVEAYCADLVRLSDEAGITQQKILPRKGDVVIWHPELPHGGSAIEREGATRRSMVFHVVPLHTPVFGPEVFFGLADPPHRRETRLLAAGGGRFMYEGSRPFFDPTG